MSSTSQIGSAVRRALMFGAVAATASLPAMAQTRSEAAAPEIETVTVTGSRIPHPQLESVSPVTSITNEALQQTGATRVEDLLNTLPQVAGAYGAGVSNGATGEATVSLRNLGANRTLVLVNGRRLMPGDPTQNGNAAPDLNQIPPTLVERVDLLTGGASAVYGADAVAGVVNFVMNDHFQGVRVEGNYSFYNHDNRDKALQAVNIASGFTPPTGNTSDGYTRNFSALVGGNFADGKGNATAYLTYRRVAPVLQAKRDYSNCSLTSTGPSSSLLGCGGSSTAYPARFNFNHNDRHLDPATGDLAPGHLFYNFAPLNYFQRPDENYTGGAFAHYEINEQARVYSEFMFMDDRTIAQIAPSGAFYGAGTAVSAAGVPDGSRAINCNNPYLTPGELTQWCGGSTASPDVHVLIGRRNVEGGPRFDDLGHTSYRAVLGIKGDITNAWTYDVYGLYGTTRFDSTYFNDVSRARMGAALDAVQLPSGQIVCRANAAGTVGAPGCVPWNIFSQVNGQSGVTQAAVNYISTPGFLRGSTTERIVDGAITGDLGKQGIKLPTAHDGLGVSFGVEYRQELSELHPDVEYITNDLAGQGSPTLPTAGKFQVTEEFMEARLPLVEDAPFAKSLVLETGYRHSDYNLAFGATNTYKFGVQWAPVSGMRFRGTYQRAVRAPNIQELFLTPRVQLDGTSDPCAGAAPAASAAACALSGVTAAEYGNIAKNPAAQYNGLVGGNTSLSPEKADTYTAGLVFTPTFLPDFNLTLDYYNITIKEFILALGGNFILDNCLGGDAASCTQVHRTQGTGTAADGSLWISPSGYIDDPIGNRGSQRVNGIDVTSGYRLDFGGLGKLNLDFVGGYVLKNATQPLAGGPAYDCAGFYGATCGVATPRWKHKLRGTWNTPLAGLDVYTAWRRTNGVAVENTSPNPLLSNALQAPAVPGRHLTGEDYIDLGGSYTFAGHLTARLGANNVFDKSPPVSSTFYLPTVFGNGGTLPQVYDALGRYVYLSLTADF